MTLGGGQSGGIREGQSNEDIKSSVMWREWGGEGRVVSAPQTERVDVRSCFLDIAHSIME